MHKIRLRNIPKRYKIFKTIVPLVKGTIFVYIRFVPTLWSYFCTKPYVPLNNSWLMPGLSKIKNDAVLANYCTS